MPATDADLLRLFIRYRDEEAFRILADRYLGLIYGAALRRSGHREIAEEAAQNVLILLVRKAPDLVNDTAILSGWLHRAATFEAANLLRIEHRHQRTKDSLMRQIADPRSSPDPTWRQVVPHLDAALARLPAIDRSIVLMHYLQGKTHNEIAAAIGKTGSAVQRRCHRSIGKLARMLKARGITISGATLASSLSLESRTAPVGLLTKVVSGALCNSGALTLPYLSQLILLMTTTQKVILTGAAVAVIASAPVMIQQSYLNKLRSSASTEKQFVESPHEPPRLTAEIPNQPDSQPEDVIPSERRPILTNEDELAAMKEELEEALAKIDLLLRPLNKEMLSATVQTDIGPDEVLVTGGYQLPNGKYQFTFVSPERVVFEKGKEIIRVTSNTLDLDEEMVAAAGLEGLTTNAANTLQHAEAWKKDEYQATVELLEEYEGVAFTSAPQDVDPGKALVTVASSGGYRFNAEEEEGILSIEGGDVGVVFEAAAFDFREDEAGFDIKMRVESTENLKLDRDGFSAFASAYDIGRFRIVARVN